MVKKLEKFRKENNFMLLVLHYKYVVAILRALNCLTSFEQQKDIFRRLLFNEQTTEGTEKFKKFCFLRIFFEIFDPIVYIVN